MISTVQWQPNDAFLSTLDLYYSKDNQDTHYGGFEAGTVYGPSGVTLTNPVVSDGVLVGGTWNNLKPVLREELDDHNDKIYEIGWNNKFKFADHWTATADLSYGKATSKQSFMEQYAGTVPGSPGATDNWNIQVPDVFTGQPFITPGLNYADPNIIKLVDSGGWGQDGYLKDLNVTDEIKAARFDLSRDINSFISKIDVGVNYNERTKTRNSDEWFLDLPGGKTSSANIPTNCLVSPIYIGYLGFPPTIAWDPACNMSSYQLIPNINGDITAKDWKVQEKVTTGYFQANIDTDVAGMPLRGNIGAQYVHTDQSSNAFANTGEAATSGGISYSNFLPDLNLVLSLPEEMDLRFAAGKQLSRARLDDEKASVESSISVPPPGNYTGTPVTCAPTGVPCLWTAGGGNPELKPFLANAYDLSWEKYWENKGYVQASVFYKQLKTYIYTIRRRSSISLKLGVPDPNPNLTPSSSVGLGLTLPVNGTGGFMRGYELSASLPLELFWDPLDGFGVQASYAMTDSSIQPNGPGTSSRFPGLSKYVSNATAYYEKAGFSVRVSEIHRSNYLGEVRGVRRRSGFRQRSCRHVYQFPAEVHAAERQSRRHGSDPAGRESVQQALRGISEQRLPSGNEIRPVRTPGSARFQLQVLTTAKTSRPPTNPAAQSRRGFFFGNRQAATPRSRRKNFTRRLIAQTSADPPIDTALVQQRNSSLANFRDTRKPPCRECAFRHSCR